jgi:hypothetical protein
MLVTNLLIADGGSFVNHLKPSLSVSRLYDRALEGAMNWGLED